MDKIREFELNGVIDVKERMTEDEFFQIFTDFLESRGWSYGGGIHSLNSNGNPISGQGVQIPLTEPTEKERKELAEIMSKKNTIVERYYYTEPQNEETWDGALKYAIMEVGNVEEVTIGWTYEEEHAKLIVETLTNKLQNGKE